MVDTEYWSREKAAHERALELLSLFGMADLADHQAGSLPYGAQRRLEIVRALATNPSLLLLDEPAAGMNSSETAELMENILLPCILTADGFAPVHGTAETGYKFLFNLHFYPSDGFSAIWAGVISSSIPVSL